MDDKTKVYLAVQPDKVISFLKEATKDDKMKLSNFAGSFESKNASGNLEGYGLTLLFTYDTSENLTLVIVKKVGLAYFLKNEKIWSITDSYANKSV